MLIFKVHLHLQQLFLFTVRGLILSYLMYCVLILNLKFPLCRRSSTQKSQTLGLILHCFCCSNKWSNLANIFPVELVCQSVDRSCTVDLQVENVPKITPCHVFICHLVFSYAFKIQAHANQRGMVSFFLSPSFLIATVSLPLPLSP